MRALPARSAGRARNYAPGTGRFTSRDGLSPNAPGTQGWTPDATANPATLTDPSGRAAICWICTPVAAAALVPFVVAQQQLAATAPIRLRSPGSALEWAAAGFALVAALFACILSPSCREDVGTVVGGAIDGVEEIKWGLGGAVGSIGGVISHLIRSITKADDPAITDVGFPPAPPLPPGGNRPPPNRCFGPDDWLEVLDLIWETVELGKEYGGEGRASSATADLFGKQWVGDGWTWSRDGKAMKSADGSRTYRPAKWKPQEGRRQANFELWETGRTNPQNPSQPARNQLITDWHIDIDESCP